MTVIPFLRDDILHFVLLLPPWHRHPKHTFLHPTVLRRGRCGVYHHRHDGPTAQRFVHPGVHHVDVLAGHVPAAFSQSTRLQRVHLQAGEKGGEERRRVEKG